MSAVDLELVMPTLLTEQEIIDAVRFVNKASVEDEKLAVTVHLSVFYGYQFTKLAQDVRQAVAEAVASQMGMEVCRVDVSIDGLVFPRE